MNRRAFLAELNGFADDAHEDTAAVMILDLDRFKEINDRLGHETGDHVLQAFAQRLTESLSTDAVTARLGGDEFAVLLRSAGPDDAMAEVYKLHHALSRPLIVDGFPLSTGTSIGVALAPQHGSTANALIHAADIAMYRAKQFRSGVELFEDIGGGKDRGRVALLADLTGAIENREFTLHYQPQVSMITGSIVSIEALIRWDHPRLGRIAPGDFISLAEQTDLIDPLTDLVIRTSLEEIAPIASRVALAVNVSARNLQDGRFAGKVLALLAANDFAPERFEIELTESSIANEPERTEMAFHELRDAGVRVSVDDFGTGYSSFAMLRDLDVDKIKIDRSLVSEVAMRVRDRRIVSSIIDLAHALGCEVVAEGIESESVWSHLADVGCDLAQGFAVARPMTGEQIVSLLEGDAPIVGPVARSARPKKSAS
jgi:diguanylate cyclase (GGDEF)-like protein